MKKTLQLILLLLPFSVTAQSNEMSPFGSIKGIVITVDSQSAASVSIHIKNTSRGAITDTDGKFFFEKVNSGNYILAISLLGYSTIERQITVQPKATTEIEIQLLITSAELADVIVSAKTGSNYVETKTSDGLKLNLPYLEIPQNIVSTTKALITSQGLVTMNETIRNVSGVQRTYGSLNDYSLNIRGTNATFNVFRNGMSGYWWNQQEDAAMIEKIEFIKGPAAFMSGIAEPGGFVNIETKQPVKEPIVYVNTGIGSFRMKRLTADIGGAIDKKKNFSYRLNAGVHYQQRAFQFSNASRFFVCTSLKYEPTSKTSITAEYNYMQGKTSGNNDGLPSIDGVLFTLPRNFSVANDNTDRLTANDEYYRLFLKHTLNKSWFLTAQAAYVHGFWGGYLLHADDYIPVSNDTLYRYTDYENWKNYSGVAQVNIGGKFHTGAAIRHDILMSLDFCYAGFKGKYGDSQGQNKFGLYLPEPAYDINTDSLKNVVISPLYKEKHTWSALYFQDHIKLLNKLVLTLGLRYTHYLHDINNVVDDPTAEDYEKHNKINAVTPRAGVSWLFSDKMSLFVLYDKSFWPQWARNREHKAFKPLTGYNTEAGFKGYLYDRTFSYSLSLFHIVKNNTLTPDPLDNNFYVQRGQVISNGVDLDITGEITPAIVMNANYEFVDAKTTKDSDPLLVGIKNLGTAAHSGSLWLKYRWWKGKLKGLSLSTGYQYMGKQSAVWYYNPDPDTRFFPAYHLLDAGINYTNQQFSIGLNVYNITNGRYALNGYFSPFKEWRYTPGDPVNFRLNVGINLLHQKRH